MLREVDGTHRICEELAGCFSDHRNQDFVEHDLAVMLRQRIMGIALGYSALRSLKTPGRMSKFCLREGRGRGEWGHETQTILGAVGCVA